MKLTVEILEKMGFCKIPWKEPGKREIAYQYKTLVLTQYIFQEGFFYSFCGENSQINTEEHLLALLETIHGEKT